MGKLDGKVAVITGASRGIGRGIALSFAREGAHLLLTARTAQGLEATVAAAREFGVRAEVMPGDASQEADVERVFAAVRDRFGRLDLLVNNAGAFDGGLLHELDLATWNKVIGINLTGPFLCTRAALQIMRPQGVGRIINVSSVSAYRVRPTTAAYSATKAALLGLTQVTALEGREYGVTCGCLLPGNTA